MPTEEPYDNSKEDAGNGSFNDEDKPKNWEPDIKFSTSDFDLFNWDDSCFAEAKLTMINLWAYWCGPCMLELPDIEKLSNEYADKGLQVFGLTYPEEEKDNRAVAEDLGLSFQILLYTDDFDEYMDSGYLPTTIFVDSNGKVLGDAVIGAREYDEWKGIIEQYLAE